MAKKTTKPTKSTLDPVGYDINTDPKRWEKLTNWCVVAEMIGTSGQDSMTGGVAVPPVQHGVMSEKITPDAKWSKEISELYKTKPAFAGLGHAKGAHFTGDGKAVRHGSEVTIHIDRDLKPEEVTGAVAVLPDTGQMYADMQVGDWVSGGGNYLGDVEINMPDLNDPEFKLPSVGTVFTFDSDTDSGLNSAKKPVADGLDGGTFRLRVMPVPDFYITIESPGCVDVKNVRQHVISADPKMPDLLVRMTALGLTPEEDKHLAREVEMTVSYTDGGRDDKKTFKEIVTGPDWKVDWGGKFYGGNLEIKVSAVLPWGKPITGSIPVGQQHVIRGKNPSRASIRKALGGDAYTLIIAYQESRFAQFGNSATTTFHSEPLPPLHDSKHGFGIGQLTTLRKGKPTSEDLWNWQENAKATADYAQYCRARGIKYANDIYKKFPKAPHLTEAQTDDNGWQLYNAGPSHLEKHAYWIYDGKKWSRNPIGSYVDDCHAIGKAVAAGKPPAGWN